MLVRRPGPAREGHHEPCPDVVASLGALTVPGVVWAAPVHRGFLLEPGVERFVVPGPASVATLVLGGMPPAAVATMLRPVGGALGAVHASPLRTRRAPAAVRRLHSWLLTGRAPGEGARLHAALTDRPAFHRFAVDATERVLSAPACCALGAPGQSVLYPHPDGSATTVLLTDEVGDAPPEWDLGWLLGELLELLNAPARAPEPRPLAGFPPADALLAGYDAPLDEGLLARTCLLRWLLHLHDYAAYVDWDDDLLARLDRIAALAADLPRVLG
ncbi:hypothetical protein GCM10023226_03420 [Nocardioides nanhaiensis]|uniref:Aminoglycoside phosphotransferase domain-containing protein n=1 Tax=Nocardioides nanhaiensis TaxID=1476871 RepID=A0ABP8VRX8_9ACTN